jgi:hypothetical protein
MSQSVASDSKACDLACSFSKVRKRSEIVLSGRWVRLSFVVCEGCTLIARDARVQKEAQCIVKAFIQAHIILYAAAGLAAPSKLVTHLDSIHFWLLHVGQNLCRQKESV